LIFRHLCLLLVLVSLLAAACVRDDLQQDTMVMEQGIPEENARQVRVVEYRDERLDYIIEAARMERFTDRRIMYGYDVTLTSYDREGEISAVIKADTTIVDDARNIIFANGNAVFSNKEGEIKTQKMVWERNLDEITVPTKLTLTRAGDVLRGNSLRTNTRLSFAEMDVVSAEGYFDEEDFTW
jgi:LPS export ABC transporter protein LptC